MTANQVYVCLCKKNEAMNLLTDHFELGRDLSKNEKWFVYETMKRMEEIIGAMKVVAEDKTE